MRAIPPHLELDLRYAIRSLRTSPLFATVAILSLGLALALNTTMFALVDAVLNPPVPFRDAERVREVRTWGGNPARQVPGAERYRAFAEGSRSYDAITSYGLLQALVQTRATAEDHIVAVVPPNFFDVTGVRPDLGRTLGVVDSGSRGAPAVVVSHRLYRRLFVEKTLIPNATLGVGTGIYQV